MTSQLVYNFSSSRAERNGAPMHKHNSDGKIEHCHVFENIEYEYTPVFGYISEYISYHMIFYSISSTVVINSGKVSYNCKNWLNPVNLSYN